MDVSTVGKAFPDLDQLNGLGSPSGQKDVFFALRAGEKVVLKLVKPYRGCDERTDREIIAVKSLHSSYVPTIYEHGRREVNGEVRRYILEQFVDGETLEHRLQVQPVQDVQFVLNLIQTLLSACMDFEQVHIVHRDIKPANLIVGPDMRVWVIDFGIARHLDLTALTLTGRWGLGTWGYAAPEQMRNMQHDIDGRADLYSIGISSYEALTGRHPYLVPGESPIDTIRRMESVDPPRLMLPADPTGEFGLFLSQLVQRYPSRRPQTATEALAWFESFRDSCGNGPGNGSKVEE